MFYQVLGAAWYLLSLDRYTSCWKSICKNETTAANCSSYLNCFSFNHDDRKAWSLITDVFTKCNPGNDIDFKYGIFENAVKKNVVSSNFFEKYFYCLWWGLQNLRYLLLSNIICELPRLCILSLLSVTHFFLTLGPIWSLGKL